MDQPTFYQIRVKGHLEETWRDWFDGLEVDNQASGEALISGRFLDQSALFGILIRISNLGLSLISVNSFEEDNTSLPPGD